MKTLMQLAIPSGIAALLAVAVALGGSESRPMIDAGTAYSFDHARIQQAAADSDPSPTF